MDGYKLRELYIKHVVVGSGAAGYHAALRLYRFGEHDTAVVTEDRMAGTSRNTGSDKQTYYKLSLSGGYQDSVRGLAEDLFAGQCVDGDTALCEAALSPRCFYFLAELGVPFPDNEYGEFMGYKTDHDKGRRATSVGPYTSKVMTECLERAVLEQGIPVYDKMQVIRLLVKDGQIRGLLCLEDQDGEAGFAVIWCDTAVLATGGPAGMYRDSVYPSSQLGSSGIAFEAGVKGKNLTEWQFGMASLHPRWNVSGTYMQALPRFVSTARDGSDEREFLWDFFENPAEMLSMVFLKGYQWPFDTNKIFGGSSIIDLLVYQETVIRGRRVFLDYRENPGGAPISYDALEREAYEYLEHAGACFGTPIQRLGHMNEKAVEFYREHGVDLCREMLEIAVCAQHNNGGLAADAYWQTDITGLFAVGEVCGSHGVTRPGGTALNAGQAGSYRAADYIAHLRNGSSENEASLGEWKGFCMEQAKECMGLIAQCRGEEPVGAVWERAAARMSRFGGMIREKEGLKKALEETQEELENLTQHVKKPVKEELSLFYHLRDMLISQKMYLSAMYDYAQKGGGSRGSALYSCEEGQLPDRKLPECYRCRLDMKRHGGVIQEILLKDGQCGITWRPVREIPNPDYFFENQWKAYLRRGKNGKEQRK